MITPFDPLVYTDMIPLITFKAFQSLHAFIPCRCLTKHDYVAHVKMDENKTKIDGTATSASLRCVLGCNQSKSAHLESSGVTPSQPPNVLACTYHGSGQVKPPSDQIKVEPVRPTSSIDTLPFISLKCTYTWSLDTPSLGSVSREP